MCQVGEGEPISDQLKARYTVVGLIALAENFAAGLSEVPADLANELSCLLAFPELFYTTDSKPGAAADAVPVSVFSHPSDRLWELVAALDALDVD